jgi:hypothetical protein
MQISGGSLRIRLFPVAVVFLTAQAETSVRLLPLPKFNRTQVLATLSGLDDV